MNWEAIGAVANVLAALGVMATLIYLAIQIRQNTKAVRSSSIENLIHSLAATAHATVENEYVVPLMLKANAEPETFRRRTGFECTSGSS